MTLIAVTNNSLITQTMSEKNIFSQIIFSGSSLEDVLKISMGLVKNGHTLLLHPLLGNIPPYETPFKTVILSEKNAVIDFNSLNVINYALQITSQALDERTIPAWGKNALNDFKKNDLVIVERWLTKVYLPMLVDAREKHSGG